VAVFKKLRIPDVPGTPTMGEAAGEWIFDIVATIFGAFDQATAARMIRGLFLLVPKKNAKTTYGAAITVTAAVLNQRPRAELLMTAPSHEIADKAFAQASGMIALDDEGYLQKRFKVRDHIKTISDLKTKANLKIKTFDASIVTGSVPAFALIDEVHLLGRDPQAEAIIAQLKGGMVSVPEGFWAMITTQSFKDPAGAFKSELKIARSIRDGDIATKGLRTLPILYEFSEEQQKDRDFWQNPANWPRLTPNLGRSITVPGILELRDESLVKGEEAVRIWASQHLNVEIGLGLHSDRWAGADHWEGRADKTVDLAELIRRCVVIVVGADGGGLDDLLGMAVLGRDASGKRLLWNKAWAHKGVLERRKSEAARLRDFEREGDLAVVDKMEDAFADMAKLIDQVKASGKLGGVAVDPAGVKHIMAALDTIGIPEAVGISQGWKLSGAIKDVEIGLADGTLTHAGQPMMAWCVSNAKAEAKGNAITITKQVAGSAKIDPLVATFIAESLMGTNPQPPVVIDVEAMIA
jgi:phage terminase large subunit-like protein